MQEPVIVVHGGARYVPDHLTQFYIDGVKAAASKGNDLLKEGGSAVDAAVAAVTYMEDDPIFNAGRGSALTLKGEVEMDAIVVDGRDLASGAVCGVKGCRNPVQLARMVMEKTSHCLLTGQGAIDFMESQGMAAVPDSDLITPKAVAELDRYNKRCSSDVTVSPTADPFVDGCDTVGAVAMDAQGNFASATSTGGTTGKLPGRVGDSPIIGSGAYADNLCGGVSTTGHGEQIMRVCLARRVAELLEKGETAQEAAVHGLAYMTERVGGAAGLIVISRGGDEGRPQVGVHFTTTRMSWCVATGGKLRWGINPGEREEGLVQREV